jgi:hypothetical protein
LNGSGNKITPDNVHGNGQRGCVNSWLVEGTCQRRGIKCRVSIVEQVSLRVLTKNFSLCECARAIKSLSAARAISKYFFFFFFCRNSEY